MSMLKKRIELLLLLSVFELCFFDIQGTKCLQGFISQTTLRDKSALLGSFAQSEGKVQWIYPHLSFSCPTTIISFKLLAESRGQGDRYPALQVWRPMNRAGTDYEKVEEVASNLTPLNSSQSQLLRSSTLSVRVETGYIIGFYQPEIDKSRFVLYFQSESGLSSFRKSNQRNSPSNFQTNEHSVESTHAFPLVGVYLANPECASGFLTEAELSVKQTLLTNPSLLSTQLTEHGRQRRLVPEFVFGCNGEVTSVSLAAKQASGSSYPDFQIWRRDPANSSLFIRQSRASLSNPISGPFLNTLTFSLSSPLVFQEGDILGLHLPPNDSAAYLLQFLQSQSVTSYSLTSTLTDSNVYFNVNHNRVQVDNDIPLLLPKIVADCGSLSPLRNGTVEVASTRENSLATYTCNEGYALDGVSVRVCQASDGDWSGDAPSCIAVDCGVPVAPPKGSVSFESTTYLSVARYSCGYGFQLSGQSEVTCTSQRIWSASDTECAGIECNSLAIPRNGRVVVSVAKIDGTQVDSVVHYGCNTNYTLLGVSSRTCQENQSWTGEPPICVADCSPPPSIANASVSLFGAAHSLALYSVAVYTCNTGYRIHREGGEMFDRLICEEDSEWIGRLPVCEAVTCGMLQQPEFGKVQLTNETNINSLATYSCAPGFVLYGSQQRTCTSSGEWTGNDSVCVSIPTSPLISMTTFVSERETRPSQETLSNHYLAIIVIIAVLTVVVLTMGVIITLLCIQRRKYKAEEMDTALYNLNERSMDNPVYDGDQRLSLNYWDPTIDAFRFQFDSSTSNRESSIYEQPLRPGESILSLHPSESSPTLPPPSLHYDVSSIVNPSLRSNNLVCDDEPGWGEKNEHHYDVASNYRSSHGTLPASPYEIPTPSSKMATIYGSLQWGTYVPTEEQRKSSASLHQFNMKSLSQSSLVLDQLFFAEREVYWKPACEPAALYDQLAQNRYREILREQIQITAHLGSGQFGTVDKGLWQSPLGVKEVAVKTLKQGSDEMDKVKFLQEAAINGQFHHQNVVRLHGVVTMGEPVMIILELLRNGDLRNYLIRSRPAPGELISSDTPQMLLKFCADIAAGMAYLSGKAFIHRDLAARNILLTEKRACKIGDFGLSRDLEHESYYISQGGHVPVKWTAPEAIHFKKYSTASDVWSFGCVMYEIWSLGHKPFRGCSNTDAINLIDCGFRLPPPPGCPREIYELMIHCWHPDSSLRPSFSELFQSLHCDIPQLLLMREGTDTIATVLSIGGPLDSDQDLHLDLQNFYLSEPY